MPSNFYRSRSNRAQPGYNDGPLVQAYQQEASATRENDAQARQMDVIRQQQQMDAERVRQQKKAEAEAERQRTITVKVAKNAGVETEMDPTTAKESVKMRDDGTPVWQSGFTGSPRAADNGHVVDYRDPKGRTYTVPLEKINRTEGATGAIYSFDLPGEDGKPQTIRRAEEAGKPLFKVDPETGMRYAEAKDDATGSLVQQPLGPDPATANKVLIKQHAEKWEQSKAELNFQADELRLQQSMLETQYAPDRERLAELEQKRKKHETGVRYETRPDGTIMRYRNAGDSDGTVVDAEANPAELVKAKSWLSQKKAVDEEHAKLDEAMKPITAQLHDMQTKRDRLALSILQEGHRVKVQQLALEKAAKQGAQLYLPENQKRIEQAFQSPAFTHMLAQGEAEGTPMADDLARVSRSPVLDSIGASFGGEGVLPADEHEISNDLAGSALDQTRQQVQLTQFLAGAPAGKATLPGKPDIASAAKSLGITKPEEFDIASDGKSSPTLVHRKSGETIGFVDVANNRLLLPPSAIFGTEQGKQMARDASNDSVPVFVLSGGAAFTARQRADYFTQAFAAAQANDEPGIIAAGADLAGIRRNVKEGKISIQDGKWLAKTVHGIDEPDMTAVGVETDLNRYVAASKIESALWSGPKATQDTRAEVVNRYVDALAQRSQASLFYDGRELEATRAQLLQKHAHKGMLTKAAEGTADILRMVPGFMAGAYASTRSWILDASANTAANLNALGSLGVGPTFDGRPFGLASTKSDDGQVGLIVDQTQEHMKKLQTFATRALKEPELISALSAVRSWAVNAEPGEQPPQDVVSKLAQTAFSTFHSLSDDAEAKARETTPDTFNVTKDPALAGRLARYLETRNPADWTAVTQLVTLDQKSRDLADRVNAFVTRPRAATVAEVRDRAASVLPGVTPEQAHMLMEVSKKPTDAGIKRVSEVMGISKEDAVLALNLFTAPSTVDQTSLNGYFRGALVAPIQETALEAASMGLEYGFGKLAARGFAQATTGVTLKTTRRAALASRVAAQSAALVDDFTKLGMFRARLGQPLSKLARASNAVVTGLKGLTANAITGGIEEGAMELGQGGSTLGTAFEAAGQGALAAPVMMGGMTLLALPAEIRGTRALNRNWEATKADYLAKINERLAAEPGSSPITPDEFETALALYGGNAARADAEAVQAAYAAMEAGPPTPATQQALLEAVITAKSRDALAASAVTELRAVPEEQRILFVAAAKAAMGISEFTMPELRALQRTSGDLGVTFQQAPGAVGVDTQQATDLPGRRQAIGAGVVPVVSPALVAEIAQASPALGELMGMAPPISPAQASTSSQSPTNAATGATPDSGTSTNAVAAPAEGGVGHAQAAPPAPPAVGAAVESFKGAPGATITNLADGRVEVSWEGKGSVEGVVMEAKARGFGVSTVQDKRVDNKRTVTIRLHAPSPENTGVPQPRPADKKPDKKAVTEKPKAEPTATARSIEPLARRVIADITGRSPKLKQLVSEDKKAPAHATGGMWMRDDGTVAYHMPTLVKQLTGLPNDKVGKRIEALLDEEIRHAAQMHAAQKLYEEQMVQPGQFRVDFETWRDAWYGNIWDNEFTTEMQEQVKFAYGDTLPEQKWIRAMEGLRMLDQMRATGSITEAVLQHLAYVLEFLKNTLQKATPIIKQEIDAIQAVLVEFGYEQGAVNPAKAKKQVRKPKKKAPPAEAPAPAAVVPAVEIAEGWEAFPAEMGGLSVPRASMPQIKSEHRGAMVQFLKGRGITHIQEEVAPSTLKPSQVEYSPAKVAKAKTFDGPKRSILVSADNHVVDGHHQWMADLTEAPNTPIPIIRLDAPIQQLLIEVTRFPASGVDEASTGTESKPEPRATRPTKSERDATPAPAPQRDAIDEELGAAFKGLFSAPSPSLAVSVLQELAKVDELFRYPVSDAYGLPSIMTQVFAGSQFEGDVTRLDEQEETGADQRLMFTSPTGKEFYVYQRGRSGSGEVWIDVSRFEEGDFGSAVYAAVGEYAVKTRRVFVGDPAGVSEAATVRRTSAMLSLALRFGTTDYMEPSDSQLRGMPEKGIAPLRWTSDYQANVQSLIETFLANLSAQFPAFSAYQYDFRRNRYQDQGGRPYDARGLERAEGKGDARKARAGEATLRRAVFLNSLLAEARRPESRLLADIQSRRDSLIEDGLSGLFSAPASVAQVDLPRDRRDAMMKAASAVIDLGLKTPEELAQRLDKLAPNGALRKYARAFWRLMTGFDSTLLESPDWQVVYEEFDKRTQKVETSPDETEPGIRNEDQAAEPPGSGGRSSETTGAGDQRSDQDLGGGLPNNAPAADSSERPRRIRQRSVRNSATDSESIAGGLPDESRQSEGRDDSVLPRAGAAVVEPAHTPGRSNYWLADPESIVGGGAKARFARNRRALETLEALQEENRDPTPAELDALAAYTGWGAFGQELFQGTYDSARSVPEWQEESEWLRARLGKEDWTAAQDSIINSHYTDPPTVTAMWDMLRRMGFTGGRVLEPSLGVGNFFSLMPRDLMASSQLSGIELDPTTAAIAKFLHPQANIRQMGYEQSTTADNFYDLIIGNWPFKKGGPADRRYNHLNASLHDYFFVKAIDQVRPGGLVVGITSAGTMDKKNKAVRSYLAARGELVASFRLPSGSFGKYAGTNVVTDIIILKKRATPLTDVSGETWVESVKDEKDRDFFINSYYQTPEGRQNILGELGFGSGSTYGRPAMIVTRRADYEQVLPEVKSRLPENIMQPWKPEEKKVTYIANTSSIRRQNAVLVQRDDLYQVNGENLGLLQDIKPWRTKDAEKRLADAKSLLNLRGLLDALMDAYRVGEDTGAARRSLLEAYEAHIKKHGALHKSKMLDIFSKAGDPTAPDILNIEEMTAKGPRPRAILTQDIMRKRLPSASGSIADAYALARNNSLDFRLSEVASEAGVTEAEAEAFLIEKGQIYRTPQGVWEPADVYLAGNVRQKLREARAAQAEGVEGMERNITALEAIQPAETPYFEIEVQMGAAWIPITDYQDYIAGLLQSEPKDIEITKGSSGYNVRVAGRAADSPLARTQWGTEHVHPTHMFTAAMNSTGLRVLSDPDKDGVRHLMAEATDAANQKKDEIREQLVTWLWSDPLRAARLQTEYNEAMNATVTPKRDGSHLRLEGLALTLGRGEFDFRQHQRDAVWRFLLDGKGVGAHEVGTGKTFTIAGLAMEGRRLGVLRKPMILAHNANSSAIAADMTRAYPAARVLYLDNLGPQARENALRQIKLDDWDAVVVPHSLINRFALSEATMMRLVQPQLDQLESEFMAALDELDDVRSSDLSITDDYADIAKRLARVKGGHTAKNLVKRRKDIIDNIKKRAQATSKEGAITFEELGIDAIIVDEAHIFKKIPLATRKNFKGLNKEMSGAGFQLQLMTDYLKSINNGKGVFLFTGTPVTNTLNEVFNMMRFVMSDEFTSAQIANFDDWFNAFAAATTDIELTSGGTFEPVERVLSFINIPELARLAGRVFDVVRANDMPEFKPRASDDGLTDNPVGRPRKLTIPVVATMSDDQKAHKRELERRYRDYQSLDGKQKLQRKKNGGDVPIKIESDGRKSSLDHRFFDPSTGDYQGSKLNLMVGKVMEHYKEHPTATQMVFQEIGVNDYVDREETVRDGNGNPTLDADGKPVKRKFRVQSFNLLRDMVAKLVAEGVRPEEIAIFHNMSLDPVSVRPDDVLRKVRRVSVATPKEELAALMNRGEIRIAFGSTQTMGTGVNAQDWLRAMHHLDAPWTPGEFEQRNGRGWRQGNRWNTVYEYRYFTEESHDGKMWQTLLNKVRFIERFTSMLQGKGSVSRVLEGEGADTSEDGSVSDFEQSFSSAAGDPRLLVRAKLEKEVQKLQRRRQVYINGLKGSRDKIRDIGERQQRDAVLVPKLEMDHEAFQAAKETFAITINGKVFTDRKDATDALERLPRYTQRTTIGQFGAFSITAESNFAGTKFEAIGPSGVPHYFDKPSMASLEATLGFLKRRANGIREDMERRVAEQQALEGSLTKPWSRESELQAKEKAFEQIRLEITASPTPAPAWLRHGAPTGSLIYVRNAEGVLEAMDVAAHRWDANDYWLLIDNGADLVPVRYSEALTETGSRLFQDYEFVAPKTGAEEPGARAPSSAPAPDKQEVLKQILSEMPPVWRNALEATIVKGQSPAQLARDMGISEVAVGNLLRTANGRLGVMLAAAEKKLKPSVQVEDEKVKASSGRPDLAMGANPAFAAVDQRRQTAEEVTHAEMNEMAMQLFDVDADAAERLVVRWMDSGTTVLSTDGMPDGIKRLIDDAQSRKAAEMLMTAAAKVLVTQKSLNGGNTIQIARLIDLYRNTGTEQARALNMRNDPFQNPKERAAMFVSEALLTPPEAMRNEMRRNPQNRENILAAWSKEADKIKAALKADGYDIDATFAALRREQQAAERAIPKEVKVPLAKASGRTQRLVKAVLEGKTWREAAEAAKMTLEQARKAYNDFRAQVNQTGAQAADAARDALLSSAPVHDFAAQIGLPEWDEAASPDATPVTNDVTKEIKKERERKKTAGEVDLDNPVAVARLVQKMMPYKSTTFDKISEYWRASILSGPQTHVVNIVSGLAYGTYEATVKKIGVGALADIARMFGMQTDAASLADLPAMLSATIPAVKNACRDALRAWTANASSFSHYALNHQGSFKGDAFEPAIKGTKGVIIRTPFRLMLLADEFVKSFFTRIEVAAQARQIARNEGLTGQALANHIAGQLQPGSLAWERALNQAVKITFQTELKANDAAIDKLDGVAKWLQSAKNGQHGGLLKGITHFLFPFVLTPTNIFKAGVTMSPLGLGLSLIDAVRAHRMRQKGNTEDAAKLYNAARIFDDMVGQVIAWGVALIASELVMPGEDEDELPFLTGSMPWRSTRDGERSIAYRTAPPTSIRIGGRWFNYGRLDPFATALAFTVDAVKAFKRDISMDRAWAQVGVNMLTAMQDKTFLQGFSDALNALENPERFGTKWASNIVTGFVPNLLRQPIRSADENIRENDLPNDMGFLDVFATRVRNSIMPQMAVPAIDVFGRPEVKGTGTGSPQTDFLFRLLSPVQTRDVSSVDPLDVALLRYNYHAEKPFSSSAPDRELSRTVNGHTQKASLNDAEWEAFMAKSGRAARLALGGRFNGKDLSEADVDFIKETISRSQAAHREIEKRKKFNATP